MVYVEPKPVTVHQLSARTWRQWMETFLEALYEADGHVLRAVKAVSPSRATIYTHKDKCPLFSDLWHWVLTFKGVKDRPAWQEVFPDCLPPALADQMRMTAEPLASRRRRRITAQANPFSGTEASIW